jgi:broad specificity phosphatase PhoE
MHAVFLALSCQAQDSTWYFIRHFQKQAGDDPHLSELGQQNAQTLVALLKSKKLSKIYSTEYYWLTG